MDVHRVHDGRIVTTWHLEDSAGLTAQLTASTDAPTRPACPTGDEPTVG